MPYRISGKVIGDDGYPLYQQALVEELNPQGQPIANILTDEETGSFVFFAESQNSTIRVKSTGYKEKTFTASAMPAEIPLFPLDESIINLTRPKPSKTGLYIAIGTVALIAIAAYASGKKDKKKTVATAVATKTPAKAKAKPTAKTVTV